MLQRRQQIIIIVWGRTLFFYPYTKKAMGEPTMDASFLENQLRKKPCSEFLKIIVECPRCARQMQANTLQYKHKCFAPQQVKSAVLSAEEFVRRRARAEQRALENFHRRSGLGEDSTGDLIFSASINGDHSAGNLSGDNAGGTQQNSQIG